MSRRSLRSSLLLASLCGCAGEGVVVVRASGEAQATQGIAAAQFADGWAVRFEHLVVHVADVAVGDAELPGGFLIDAAALPGTPPVVELGEVAVPLGRHDVAFAITPATSAATPLHIDDGDDIAARVLDAGAAVYVEATAEQVDSAEVVTLTLALPTAVMHSDCTNGSTGKPGVVAATDGGGVADIVFHVEHLFYDTLGTEAARLRFAPIAAAAIDGHVDNDALAATPLDRRVYDAASFEVASLFDFISLSVASLGHLGGSGLCTVSRFGA
ncbi:MAG TPA: hypothetical protein VGF99_03670 [Myxococcota bacterium]